MIDRYCHNGCTPLTMYTRRSSWSGDLEFYIPAFVSLAIGYQASLLCKLTQTLPNLAMFRRVCNFVINVDKGSLDAGQCLELVLQILRHVVRD